MSDAWYQWEGNNLLLQLRIQPRASRDAFAQPMGEAYKVCITAPPVDGKANAHLVAFLAKSFGVAKGQVEILSGETGRNKRVRICAPSKIPILQLQDKTKD